jgi:hypothetical protein
MEKKKPGPKPEIFKVPLVFEDAVKAALETNPPRQEKRRKRGKSKREPRSRGS